MGQTQKSALVDFLYRDSSRIDSLFSQLFQGSLKEVAATSACANKQTNGVEGSIPGVVKGGFSGEETITETIAKKIDPYDQNILDLLSNFDLMTENSQALRNDDIGKVALLNGQIKIRDYKSLKNSMPVVFQVAPMLGYFGQTKKEFEKLSKLIQGMIDIIPLGLELEFTTSQQEVLIGNLKTDCFSDSPQDLMRIYGNNMPGEWKILGVVDALNTNNQGDNGASVRASLDGFANMIKGIYSTDNIKFSISPIVIFRELNY